jgi:hypothetical protein
MLEFAKSYTSDPIKKRNRQPDPEVQAKKVKNNPNEPRTRCIWLDDCTLTVLKNTVGKKYKSNAEVSAILGGAYTEKQVQEKRHNLLKNYKSYDQALKRFANVTKYN